MPTIATPPQAGLHEWRQEDRARRLDASSITLRMRVAFRRAALTVRLSEGADPVDSAELALRAHQLVGDRERRTLARTLQRSLEEAREPRLSVYGPVPMRRREILQAEQPLRVMIARLRDNRPVTAEGMALIERLITDGTWSPLYRTTVPGSLRRLTVLATAALEPGN